MGEKSMEHVLAIENDRIARSDESIIPAGDKRLTDIISDLFKPSDLFFLPRARAEVDTRFRQIIPYIIVRCEDRYLCYTRTDKGSESRLHHRRSLGWGGHVNLGDIRLTNGKLDVERTLLACSERELAEELKITSVLDTQYLGLIVDDDNPVGRVHVACVQVWSIGDTSSIVADQTSKQLAWQTRAELSVADGDWESWSALSLELLDLAEK